MPYSAATWSLFDSPRWHPEVRRFRVAEVMKLEWQNEDWAKLAEEWWEKYLTDDDFRLAQELDAYAVQYGYVKELPQVDAKKSAWFLDRCAETLSSPMYGNLLTFQKAKTAIRKKQKELSTKK